MRFTAIATAAALGLSVLTSAGVAQAATPSSGKGVDDSSNACVWTELSIDLMPYYMGKRVSASQLARYRDGVYRIQVVLQEQGYQIPMDSSFGPQTRYAVIAFQRAHGLPVDGYVGPATASALMIWIDSCVTV